MSRRTTTLIALLLVALSGFASHAAITFVYPAQKSWVKRSDYLILKLNSREITEIRITVNGLASDLLQVSSPEYRKAFNDFVILQAIWDTGRNEVIVEGLGDGKKLESQATEIFFNPKGDPALVPPEYGATVMHVPEREKLCVSCHNMGPAKEQAAQATEKTNPCYACHKRMLNVTYVHGPAGTFSCAYCHGAQGVAKHAPPKRDAALCFDCHTDMADKLKKRKYQHGPILAGMCEICHDPHGSPYPALLRAPINDLCESCHEQIRKGPHIVRTTTGEGHPLEGKTDPSKQGSGRQMSCISCHNPHAGDVRYFFQNNAEDRMLLCQMCHNK
jgi:predicted CXXCH cytochrome family protein